MILELLSGIFSILFVLIFITFMLFIFGGLFLILLFISWVISGIIAFIMSFICLGYSGSVGEKLLGLIFAILLGPFYWIYYSYNISYCR